MIQRFRLYFQKLSIRQKMYLTVISSVVILLVFFTILYLVMMQDLQESTVQKNNHTLELICSDLERSTNTLQEIIAQLAKDDYVKHYIDEASTQADKQQLQAHMAISGKGYNFPTNAGISGFMILRTDQDYVYVNPDQAFSRETYDTLAEYICTTHDVAAGSYLALPPDLFHTLDGLCYVMPLATPDVSQLSIAGYAVLFVGHYNLIRAMSRHYDPDTTLLITDSRDNLIYQSRGDDPIRLPKELPGGKFPTALVEGTQTLILQQSMDSSNWEVTLLMATSSILSQMLVYWVLFLLAMLLAIAAASVIITSFSRSIIHRLQEMTDVISDIRAGNLDRRYPVRYQDEISLIGGEFNRMVDQLHTYHRKFAMQELLQREAHLMALQSNINPHFLYNSLDCIRASALIHNDMKVARQIQILADMFRYTTGNNRIHGDTVTVQEELDHVYDYLAMLSFRFEDRYFVDLHIDKGLLPLYLPRLVLQPLVENAFTHGVRSMASGGRVCITGTLEEAASVVCFVVEDNGAGIPPQRLEELRRYLDGSPADHGADTFMALVNIHDRIRLFYGSPYGVTLESTPGTGTRVSLRIPIVKEKGGQTNAKSHACG